jgi:hypothetical protein
MVRASRRKHHIIYKTTCLVTGRYYIGMHSTDDLEDAYLGSGLRLLRSVKKHGANNHHRAILEDLPTREAASAREKKLITAEMRMDPECLNCGAGGLGAVDRPPTKEETRKKLSIASKAAIRTPEWCAKISASHIGKTPDLEIGKRHSEKMKGRKSTPEHVAARTAGQLSSETVDGVTYQNGREAVAALGIPGGTLTNRLLSPNWLNYQYTDAPKDPAQVSNRARGEYTREA